MNLLKSTGIIGGMTLISLARKDSMLCFSDDNGKIG